MATEATQATVIGADALAAARPIFVVGYQRSGTTAVFAALSRHSRLRQQAGTPKEQWFLQEFFRGRRRQDHRPHDGCELDRAFQREFAGLVDAFCRRHFAPHGRWLAAHPDDRLHVDDLLRLFPAARVIYLLRHPQESIWSSLHSPWLKLETRAAFLSRARLEAEWWRRSLPTIRRTLADGHDGRVLLVRHERLVADPQGMARAMLNHVEEDYEEAVAEELGRVKNSSFLKENEGTDGLRNRLAESSRDPAFCRIIAEVLGDALGELGYPAAAGAEREKQPSERGSPADRLHVYFSRHLRRAQWLARLLGV